MKLRRGVRLIGVVLIVLVIVGLGRNLVRLWRAGDRLKQAEEKVASLRAENVRLKQEEQVLGSERFFEEQVRDKLNMAKPGEALVLLPPAASLKPSRAEEPKAEPEDLPVWRQWVELFW
jgi:cell division protein FtsB